MIKTNSIRLTFSGFLRKNNIQNTFCLILTRLILFFFARVLPWTRPSLAVQFSLHFWRARDRGADPDPTEKTVSDPLENLDPNPTLKQNRSWIRASWKGRIRSGFDQNTRIRNPDRRENPGPKLSFLFSPLSHSCFSNACQAWMYF